MSMEQTGHTPGGVPPKFFMFIVFFPKVSLIAVVEYFSFLTYSELKIKGAGKKSGRGRAKHIAGSPPNMLAWRIREDVLILSHFSFDGCMFGGILWN